VSGREIWALVMTGVAVILFVVVIWANFGDVPKWWTRWRKR